MRSRKSTCNVKTHQLHMSPKVTVYISCCNYGRFLREAINSVLNQSLDSWELFLVNDGSKDQTSEIMTDYKKRHRDKITFIDSNESNGLRAWANYVIENAKGEYIMRLDADDILDENALLVLSMYLDNHPDISLVFPNYMYVNEDGEILAVENRRKIGVETQRLDLPAHGACTMIRREVLWEIGCYNTNFTAQDGYELWLKVIDKYSVGNVSTPLFYYRQHDNSMSKDETQILESRMAIKRHIVANGKDSNLKILGIIPVKNTYRDIPNIALTRIAGKPLIDYSIDETLRTEGLDKVIITTDDNRVMDYCRKYENLITLMRPKELSRTCTLLSQVTCHAVEFVEKQYRYYPDIIVVLSIHSPLRTSHHIRTAIDTLILYKQSSVISVFEDHDLHLKNGTEGLVPLNWSSLEKVRLEREALYTDNGAVRAFWRDTLSEKDIFGRKIGHMVMQYEDSFQIKDHFSLKTIERRLKSRREICDFSIVEIGEAHGRSLKDKNRATNHR